MTDVVPAIPEPPPGPVVLHCIVDKKHEKRLMAYSALFIALLTTVITYYLLVITANTLASIVLISLVIILPLLMVYLDTLGNRWTERRIVFTQDYAEYYEYNELKTRIDFDSDVSTDTWINYFYPFRNPYSFHVGYWLAKGDDFINIDGLVYGHGAIWRMWRQYILAVRKHRMYVPDFALTYFMKCMHERGYSYREILCEPGEDRFWKLGYQ